jgi:hypothetical protein
VVLNKEQVQSLFDRLQERMPLALYMWSGNEITVDTRIDVGPLVDLPSHLEAADDAGIFN